MRSLVLSLAVLMCVSVAQADVLYDFDDLATGLLDTQVDGEITWHSVANPGHLTMVDQGSGDLAVNQPATDNKQEQIYTQMTDRLTDTSCLDLLATDTVFVVKAKVTMNRYAAGMIGIFVDGMDGNAPNNLLSARYLDPNGLEVGSPGNLELLVQFGITAGGKYRVRGAANGSPSVTTTYLAPVALTEMTFYLVIDTEANLGNGEMDFYAQQDSCGNWIGAIENVAMGLLDAGDPDYAADPSLWTGWWLRNQYSGISEANSPGGMYIDDLEIIVDGTVPEPATLSLLVLGGLACIRRRR